MNNKKSLKLFKIQNHHATFFSSPLATGPEVDEHIIKEFAVEELHSGEEIDFHTNENYQRIE